jgi:hypothetical protein
VGAVSFSKYFPVSTDKRNVDNTAAEQDMQRGAAENLLVENW